MLSKGFSEEWASHLHCMMSPTTSVYYMITLVITQPHGTGTGEVTWPGTGSVHCLAMEPVLCMRAPWSHCMPCSTPMGGDSDIA